CKSSVTNAHEFSVPVLSGQPELHINDGVRCGFQNDHNLAVRRYVCGRLRRSRSRSSSTSGAASTLDVRLRSRCAPAGRKRRSAAPSSSTRPASTLPLSSACAAATATSASLGRSFRNDFRARDGGIGDFQCCKTFTWCCGNSSSKEYKGNAGDHGGPPIYGPFMDVYASLKLPG